MNFYFIKNFVKKTYVVIKNSRFSGQQLTTLNISRQTVINIGEIMNEGVWL